MQNKALNIKSSIIKKWIVPIVVAIILVILAITNRNKVTLDTLRNEYFENAVDFENEDNYDSDINNDINVTISFSDSNSFSDIRVPDENNSDVLLFLQSVELGKTESDFDLQQRETILSVYGHSSDNNSQYEIYHFSEDYSKVYIESEDKKTETYKILNVELVEDFFEYMYSSETYSVDGYSGNVYEPNSVKLNFEELYSAKTPYVGNPSAVTKILNNTPLGKTTVCTGIEITKTANLNGVTWNVKKLSDFDHGQQLTQSVLLTFILIDNIDYLDVNIEEIVDVHYYRYDRTHLNEVYGRDIREYGESPELLMEFITSGYKIEKLLLATSESGGIKTSYDLPQDYSVEDAVANGDYVNVHGETYNREIAEKFVKDVSNPDVKEAYYRKVVYTIEGEPIITNFIYKDNKIVTIIDNSRDSYRGYEPTTEVYEPNIVMYHDSETLGGEEYYYVTNLEEITKQDFENGFDGELLYSKTEE